jgi:hypothetical protein
MAVTTVTTTMAAGINYTVVTDSPVDWSSVTNSTYFYNKTDKLVHYKDSTGVVQKMFSTSGVTVSTTSVTSGTNTRVIFQEGGVIQQDANFTYNNTQKRLTLKAVGTAATDIPFAVQNSGGGSNLFTVRGDQAIEMIATTPSTNGGILITKTDTYNSPRIQLYNVFAQLTDINGSSITTSNFKCGNSGAAGYMGIVNPSSQDRFLKFINLFGQETLSIGGNNYDGAATFTMKSWAGTSPGNIFTIIKSDNTNPFVITDTARVGIGTNSPQSRLDVRAQGALSTDIAFRVRNSVDSANILSVQGDGQVIFSTNTTNTITIGGTSSRPTIFGSNIQIGVSTSGNRLSFASSEGFIGSFNHTNGTHTFRNSFNDDRGGTLILGDQNSALYFHAKNGQNLYLSTSPNTAIKTWQKSFWIQNGVPPDESLVDHFAMYSNDITANNAAPHFRTENGAIVKLYQETTGVVESTLVSGGGTTLTDTDTFDGYTLKQIVKALKNQGLLQ